MTELIAAGMYTVLLFHSYNDHAYLELLSVILQEKINCQSLNLINQTNTYNQRPMTVVLVTLAFCFQLFDKYFLCKFISNYSSI